MTTLPTKTALCFFRSTTSGLTPALVTLIGFVRSARSAWADGLRVARAASAATTRAAERRWPWAENPSTPGRQGAMAQLISGVRGFVSGRIVIGTEIADHSSPHAPLMRVAPPLYAPG